ncbi:sphingosine kinase 1 isoform X2 [Parasteatoda tepidariorum]|uniref:sphingosine kinase 1 isoform X1 n=1 Tax=Parasteatoda tepidariorum TaxID=114398 RepID=UPI001C71836A|nr:sphingosine kinase 1 [Parasteatoda tepidariorum]
MAFNSSSETVILEDTFYSYPLTSVVCNLILTEKILFIHFVNKGKDEVEKLFLHDVIGCRVLHGKDKLKNDPKDHFGYFCVYAYLLKTSAGLLSKQLRRERKCLTFQARKYETQEENIKLVETWKRALSCLLRGRFCVQNGEVHIPDSVPPHKNFLILINPKSGCGKAHQIFKQWVVPVFQESDTEFELLITDRANCARDFVKKADLSQWDGIVVVSGDGLLFEVYNGLMARSDWKEVIKIPVGVVPGGSGNGLARAINYAIGEPYDVNIVTPSVLNLLKGRTVPMDIVRVQSPKECFYSFLSVGWGLMADIDIESERLRAIGEARFAVWGVIRAIGLRKYKGRLSYLPVKGFKPTGPNKNLIEPKPKRSKTIDCKQGWTEDTSLNEKEIQPNMFRSKSFGTHEPAVTDTDNRTVRLMKFSFSGDKFDSYLSSLSSLQEEDTKNIPHHHCDDEQEEDSGDKEDKVGSNYCPPLEKPVPEDWTVVDDEFVMVYACHQTHLSTDVLFAPDARMDDGIIWLIVIRAGISRAQAMYFLSCLQTGEHVNVPYVDVIPVNAFRLEPHKSEGYLTVDGEVIPCCPIQAEVMPSVARVMSR